MSQIKTKFIVDAAVTNAKLANMADNTVKANKSGSSAAPSDLALSDVAETGSAILTISNGSKSVVSASNLTIQVQKSDATHDGYLASTDFNTFAAKLSATLTNAHILVGNGSNVATDVAVSGDLTLANTGAFTIANGAVTNAKVNATAAIDFSKLASLTSAHILVGNGSNVATDTAVSGDVTITNAGVTAIGSNKVTNSQLAQMAAHTFKGNNTGSTANALDLTATQLTAELNVVVGDSGSGGTKGLVPAPGAGDAAAGKFLKADGTFAVPSSGFTWSTVSGTTQTIAVGNAYIATNAGITTFTLPSTAAVGTSFAIVGAPGCGGWVIAQNSGQYVVRDSVQTATGVTGSLSSSQNQACVELVTVTADTAFEVRNSQGTTAASNSASAYVMGGFNGVSSQYSSIEKLLFSNEAISTLSATSSSARQYPASTFSSTKMYEMGGETAGPTRVTTIDALTFISETAAALSATLTQATAFFGGCSSSTKGYTMGGSLVGGGTSTIEALTFSGETVANISATLDMNRTDTSAFQSSTKGYLMGSSNGTGTNTAILSLTFSGETVSTLSAVLTTGVYAPSNNNSSTKGYAMGGARVSNGAVITTIQSLVFSGETFASVSATLGTAVAYAGGSFSPTKGYSFGGDNEVSTYYNTIQALTFSGETTATLGATLSANRTGSCAGHS